MSIDRLISRNPVMRSLRSLERVDTENKIKYDDVVNSTIKLVLRGLAVGGLFGWGAYTLLESARISGPTYVHVLLYALILFTMVIAALLSYWSVHAGSRYIEKSKFYAGMYTDSNALLFGFTSALLMVWIDALVVPVAILATVGVFMIVLLFYKNGWVRATKRFRKTAFVLLIASVLFGLFMFATYLAAPDWFIHSASWMNISIPVAFIILASMFLVIEFDNVYEAVDEGLHTKYRWMLALGLLVDIFWIYVSMLELVGRMFLSPWD